MCLFCGYVLDSVIAVAVSMVLAIAVRSILSELYLGGLMDERLILQISGECILAIIFIFVHWFFSDWIAFALILFSYLIFLGISYWKHKDGLYGGKQK